MGLFGHGLCPTCYAAWRYGATTASRSCRLSLRVPINFLNPWEIFVPMGENVTSALKHLLETKHLYQSIKVECPPGAATSKWASELAARWYQTGQQADEHREELRQRSSLAVPWFVEFAAPDARMFCKPCDRLEPFNPLSLVELTFAPIQIDGSKGYLQDWAAGMPCQGCKGVVEVFLIRRHGLKLTLSGRAPIEDVSVEPFVPTPAKEHLRDARLAYQSGQTLSGLFQLRTAIERWTKSQVPGVANVDDAWESYMKSLGGSFNSQFPSLRDLYTKLSQALHTANSDDALYVDCDQKIVQHFDARRLFRLST